MSAVVRESIYRRNAKVRRKLVEELRHIADTGEHASDEGVCCNTSESIDITGLCQHMYETCVPIGKLLDMRGEYIMSGRWNGERKEMRMLLAGFLAAWVEDRQ